MDGKDGKWTANGRQMDGKPLLPSTSNHVSSQQLGTTK
jgi:hypothetical protein